MTALSSFLRRAPLALMFLLLFSVAAFANFYPLEAVQSGLRGTGKTVVQGTRVETFQVDYLGVLADAGPSGDLILVRVSGDVIDRTGGIAAGMSGSPVYIDDQLVGAIGYGYEMADHRIGLVTPVDDMLDVLRLMPAQQQTIKSDDAQPTDIPWETAPLEGIAVDDRLVQGAILADSAAAARRAAENYTSDTLVFAPLRTPLLAGGFGARALERLGEQLAPYSLVPMQAGGAPADAEIPVKIEPGSAFTVQLMRGDMSLASIGTVTHVDDDLFVGFGHPFMNRGDVDFIAGGAYVHHVVQSQAMPFKIGAPLAAVGTLLQDRGAAVGARIGAEPNMIPVEVRVHDQDRDTTVLRNFEIVDDAELTVDLAATGALASMDRILDRIGRGTARVVFQVEGDELPRPLVRDNLYYSDWDITALSLLEFVEAVGLVANNRFSPINISRLTFTAQIQQERFTAHIEGATPSKTRVVPGEIIDIDVRLRPYRGEPFTETVSIKVPEDALPGLIAVDVRGGGWGVRPPADDDDVIIDDPEESMGAIVPDLNRLLEQFVRRERNNEIVAEFFTHRDTQFNAPVTPDENGAGTAETTTGGTAADVQQTAEDEFGETSVNAFAGGGWVVASRSTNYVVLGSQMFDVLVVRDRGEGRRHADS